MDEKGSFLVSSLTLVLGKWMKKEGGEKNPSTNTQVDYITLSHPSKWMKKKLPLCRTARENG